MCKRCGILGLLLLISSGGCGSLCARDSAQQQEQPGPTSVRLEEVADGFTNITDVQFVPGEPGRMVVLEKAGKAYTYDLNTKKREELFSVKVLTASEEGLLGLAFHPDYPTKPCFYVNYVADVDGQDTTKVTEWCNNVETRVILQQPQPYANHNGGMLLFGPDGYLYIPLGDGGSGGDPQGNGQNLNTWLAKILRIDINNKEVGKEYAIPSDNPFVGRSDAKPEIYAYGMRNPWRGSFDEKGRLVVGDVGQSKREEITVVVKGGNHGWNCFEGSDAYSNDASCQGKDFIMPIHEYGRDDGVSITGGFLWEGKYIFGDFGSGRIWAIDLPHELPATIKPTLLGKFDIAPVTFARDASGRLYVADYAGGKIYRLTRND